MQEGDALNAVALGVRRAGRFVTIAVVALRLNHTISTARTATAALAV